MPEAKPLAPYTDLEELGPEAEGLSASVAKEVIERDKRRCVICGAIRFELHHVIFKSQGGDDTVANMVCLCPRHHRHVHEEKILISEFDGLQEPCHIEVIDTETGEVLDVWVQEQYDIEESADEAFDHHRAVLKCKDATNLALWHLGKHLRIIRDNDLYLPLGHDTFKSYLGDPEVSISWRWAYTLITVNEMLEPYPFDEPVEELAGNSPKELVQEVGPSKLERIKQFQGDDDFPQWVETARDSRSDLNQKISEAERDENEAAEDEDEGIPDDVLDELDEKIRDVKESGGTDEAWNRLIKFAMGRCDFYRDY